MNLSDLMRGMDIADIRRANTRLIIDECFHGKAVELATALGRDESYMSRILTDKSYRVKIGDRLARSIEQAAGKQPGWMDIPHEAAHGIGQDILNIAMTIAALGDHQRKRLQQALDLAQIQIPLVEEERPQLRVVTSDSNNSLQVSDPKELELIWVWRHTTDQGRTMIDFAVAAADSFINRKPAAIPSDK